MALISHFIRMCTIRANEWRFMQVCAIAAHSLCSLSHCAIQLDVWLHACAGGARWMALHTTHTHTHNRSTDQYKLFNGISFHCLCLPVWLRRTMAMFEAGNCAGAHSHTRPTHSFHLTIPLWPRQFMQNAKNRKIITFVVPGKRIMEKR